MFGCKIKQFLPIFTNISKSFGDEMSHYKTCLGQNWLIYWITKLLKFTDHWNSGEDETSEHLPIFQKRLGRKFTDGLKCVAENIVGGGNGPLQQVLGTEFTHLG